MGINVIYDSSPIDPKVHMNDKQDLRDSSRNNLRIILYSSLHSRWKLLNSRKLPEPR